MILVWMAPLFMLFEGVQLYIAARYIGLEQIRRGLHPLEVLPRGPELLSAAWLAWILASYVYQITLAFQPYPYKLPGLLMVGVSASGLLLRRFVGLKGGLVVMTFEAPLRGGFMAYLFIAIIFHPHLRGWPTG